MNSRTIAMMALVGIALGAATAFQAQAICKGASMRVDTVSANDDTAAGIRAREVAAEGRVVTYPGLEVKVAAERGGRVVRVAVEEGQRVQKGELLIELDSDTLRASLSEARARLTQSEAEIHLAELNQKRRQDLATQEVIAAKDLDQANRDLDVARAQRDTARAEIERLNAELRKTKVVAPISGTVVARSIDAGETVDTNDPLVTVADLGHLRVSGEADEADAAALVLGAPVTVTSDGYPGQRWKGVIEDVAHSVTLRAMKPEDPSRPTDTRVIAVKVALSEPSPLRLGTTVELAITADAAASH